MPFIPNPDDDKKPWKSQACNHPEHRPPGYIVLKPGTHKYQCPACGHVTIITQTDIMV